MNPPALDMLCLQTGYGTGRRRRVVSAPLTASLPPASLTALVGTNGAGKSTLLRTLAGLQSPLGGEVRCGGRRLGDFAPRELARELAVVLTDRVAVEGLTARQVAESGRMPHTSFGGRLAARDRRVVEEALRLAGAAELADRTMDRLSDGERQRVMIAKALAQQTSIILLDEPTAFLDFASRVAVLRLLRRLAKELGRTVLFSTHDLEPAFRLADRLWLLSPEGLVEGTPRELAADGTLARFFAPDGLVLDSRTLRFVLPGDERKEGHRAGGIV